MSLQQERKVTFQDECKNESKISHTENIMWFSLVLVYSQTYITVSLTAPIADKPKQEAQGAEGNR